MTCWINAGQTCWRLWVQRALDAVRVRGGRQSSEVGALNWLILGHGHRGRCSLSPGLGMSPVDCMQG